MPVFQFGVVGDSMEDKLNQRIDRRQKTLLASLLLSAWAPLATGIAVIMSHSITQVADFIRRTMEFLVLLLSWLVFRYLTGKKEPPAETKNKWERIVNLSVGVALGVSGLILLLLALFRFQSFKPGGNVIPGLVIAALGFIVNLWFLQRYSTLERENHNPIIGAQRQLYLAKILVDLCVILALSAVAFMPSHAVTRHIDALGSVAVSLYLLGCPFRAWNVKQGEGELLGGASPGEALNEGKPAGEEPDEGKLAARKSPGGIVKEP